MSVMAGFTRIRSRLADAFHRRGRIPGLRTAKSTLAAVLAFVVADSLDTSGDKILAPLTALLVVQVTMYRTVTQGLERVVSVLAGVLVAVGVAAVIGLTWWSLGLVVAGSILLGKLLRLGPHLLEVPISAMLVLAVGGAETAARGRVIETLIGAAVAVVVNLVIIPPLYAQPAEAAVRDVTDRIARFLRDQAEALRGRWSRAAAHRCLNDARRLGEEIRRADRVLAEAEESARLNPRAGPVKTAQPRLRTALTALEHFWVALRGLARALLDRTFFVPEEEESSAYREEVREVLARILDTTAEAITSVGAVASGREERQRVGEILAELERQRMQLAELLLVDPRADPAAWGQHGALLSAVDRLRVETEAAVRPPEAPWRPPRLVDRPRQAIRRLRLNRRRDDEQ